MVLQGMGPDENASNMSEPRYACIEVPRRGGGSHRRWRHPGTGGNRGSRLGAKDLKRGTVRAVVSQLRLNGTSWRKLDLDRPIVGAAGCLGTGAG